MASAQTQGTIGGWYCTCRLRFFFIFKGFRQGAIPSVFGSQHEKQWCSHFVYMGYW